MIGSDILIGQDHWDQRRVPKWAPRFNIA